MINFDYFKKKAYKESLLKILTNITENTHINKIKLLTALGTYTMAVLCEEYEYNNKTIQFAFEPMDESDGYFDAKTLKIILDTNCFTCQENLLNDIDTVVHEMRHYAQYTLKRKDSDTLDTSSVALPYLGDLSSIMASLFFDKNKYISAKKGNEPALSQYKNFNDKYYYYFHKNYHLKEYEMDARAFSINIIYDLLYDNADIKLNNFEQQNLEVLKNLATSIFEEEERNITYTEASEAIPKKCMQAEVRSLQYMLIKTFPDILHKSLYDADKLSEINKKLNGNICSVLVQSLIVSYNPDLANALMRHFVQAAKQETLSATVYDFYHLIACLFVYTNYEPTAEDMQNLFSDPNGKEMLKTLTEMKNNLTIETQFKNSQKEF